MTPETERGGRWHQRLDRGAPLAVIILVGLVLGIFIIFRLLFILELIAIAALLALVIRVIMDALERLGFPPWLAVVTIFAGIAGIGALAWFVLIPNIIEEIQALIPEDQGSFQQQIQSLISRVQDLLATLPFFTEEFVSNLPQQLQDALTGMVGSIPATLPTFASIFSTFLVGVIAVIFLTIYLAISPGAYIAAIIRLVPVDRRDGARIFFRRLRRRLRGWVEGTILVSFFVGVSTGIGLWIIGVPLPLTFGIIVGVLNVIPFLGLLIGGILPGLLALTISPTKALMVGALFIAIDQIDGNILRPLIFGREIEMSPGWVLAAILVFGVLFGPVIGTFLAIPAAVIIQVAIEELTDELPERDPSSEGDEAEENPPSDDQTP